MSKLLNIVCVLMLSIAIAQQTQAQSSTIKGQVVDENGTPVESASVYITETSQGTVTDALGKFLFEDIKEGNYTLEVREVGYKTMKETIQHQGSTVVSFTMKVDTKVLDDVDIHGEVYNNSTPISANRLNTKPIDMPSSYGYVSSQLIQDQQAIRLSEALRNVAGVYMFNKGYGGVSETVGARGISSRYMGFMFRDGIRFGTHQTSAAPELQAYERVEVLKGGAAINFGYISPGATINYVTKKPHFTTSGTVSMRAGSYSFYKPTLDYNMKVSEKLAIRIISTADIANSFREDVKTRRFYNSGSLLYKISEKNDLSFNIDYLYDKTPPDFGLPIFEDRIVTGSKIVKDKKTGKDRKVDTYMQSTGTQRLYSGLDRSRFLGSSFNNRNATQLNAHLSYNHQLSDTWKLNVRTATSLSGYDFVRTGSGFYNKYIKEGKDIKIIRTLEKEEWKERTFGAIANLTGKVSLLGIEDNMSVSIDYDNRTQIDDDFAKISNFDHIYLLQKSTQERTPINQIKFQNTSTNFQGIGLSFQNLLKVTSSFNVLLSIRADKIFGSTEKKYLANRKDLPKGSLSSRNRTQFKKGQRSESDHSSFGFTPSVGLVYKITPNNSVYASYTNSFSPNRRGYLGEDDKVLPSVRTDQFEAGVKNTFLDGKLGTNIAYYIIKGNSYLRSPKVPRRYILGQSTEYKGIELETSAKIMKGWDINVNYSYIDAKYVDGGYAKVGTRPQQTPEHQIGFWTSYKFSSGFLKNFSVNFGGEYTSERLGNDFWGTRYNPEQRHPYIQQAFTLLNAGIGYEKNRVNLRLKVTNLTNVLVYYSYRYGSVNPIDPTQFALTASYKFK